LPEYCFDIKVIYPSLEYTEITELPKITLLDLLTSIGGSLGMFISLSVFTYLEIIEILCLSLYAIFFKK